MFNQSESTGAAFVHIGGWCTTLQYSLYRQKRNDNSSHSTIHRSRYTKWIRRELRISNDYLHFWIIHRTWHRIADMCAEEQRIGDISCCWKCNQRISHSFTKGTKILPRFGLGISKYSFENFGLWWVCVLEKRCVTSFSTSFLNFSRHVMCLTDVLYWKHFLQPLFLVYAITVSIFLYLSVNSFQAITGESASMINVI